LSVGAILGLSGAVAAGLLKNGLALKFLGVQMQFTVFGAIVAGLLTGLVLGWFNGLAITKFKLPPFVATLGMLSIGRGLTKLWTGGFPITALGADFGFMGAGFWHGLPMAVLISAALAMIFYLVSVHTTLGRYIFAVGGSERAAAFAGLSVERVKVWVYALGGGLAAVAGLILTARLDAADPKAGLGYELDSIAAVVIGGTSLSGGRGSIPGTVLGCLIIGVLNNGLVLLEVSPFWQEVIKGLVILAAVAVDRLGAKKN
jgi:ribose transport system permease protein